MKKTLYFLLFLLLILSFTACGNTNSSKPTEKETINFDLSQYKEHGTLSCGLIWVKKTESTWDSSPKDYFAYFDSNGVQKSEWFSCDEYWPEDFQNNYVVLRGKKTAFNDIWDFHKCAVYNKSFSKITTLYCKTTALGPYYISDFNTQGYSFAIAYDKKQQKDVLYWIDAQGEHIFQEPPNGQGYPVSISVDAYTLKKAKYDNGYFVIVDGSNDPAYLYTKIAQIYDKNGMFVLDLEYRMRKYTEECAITSATVLNDNIVEVRFYGMDKNKYVCVMDFKGNFIKTPVLQSEYKRTLGE